MKAGRRHQRGLKITWLRGFVTFRAAVNCSLTLGMHRFVRRPLAPRVLFYNSAMFNGASDAPFQDWEGFCCLRLRLALHCGWVACTAVPWRI